jgi:HAD superfamily hydrolase (TIGR01509 family)
VHLTRPAHDSTVVVFDLGKVLLDFDYRIAARLLSKHASATPEHILQILIDTPLLARYERGEIQSPDFFDTLRHTIGFKAPFDTFATAFSNIFTPIPDMIDLLVSLNSNGTPTAVLSNTNELQINHIRQNHPFFSLFDHQILSFQHHTMKPDPALYLVLQSLTRRHGRQIVFLDDRPENVHTALSLGWQAFVHLNPQASRLTIQQLGLVPT